MYRAKQSAVRQSEPREGVAMGSVDFEHAAPSPQIAITGNSTIAFAGELYGNLSQNYSESVNGRPAHTRSDAAYVLNGYLGKGKALLAGLEGRFAAAIYDADRHECALISDKFGTKPLYYRHDRGDLAYASEIKALLTLPWLPRQLNRCGLVQFFAFGHFWNQDTLFASVQCLSAATIAIFDCRNGTIRQERYWRPQVAAQRSAVASLEALDAQLKIAVDERTLDADRLGMSLSGGLDARTMLGVMEHPRTPTTCVSLGMEGSLDQRSARALAELVHCPYHTLTLDQRFLADFERHLNNMVDLTDGHYLSQCIVMPTLPLYERLGIGVLLRGHAGELLHMRKAYNFSIDSTIKTVNGAPALEDWLFSRLQSHLTDGLEEPPICGVNDRDFCEMARTTLRLALADAAHWDDPVDRVSQVFLDQRTRRETAMSLVKFDSVAITRLPYLDGRVVEAAFAAPADIRLGDQIQTFILRKRRPEFLRPLNSNTRCAGWRGNRSKGNLPL